MKIQRFRNIDDAALSLFGEILVRYGLREITGVSNSKIQIVNTNNEKPYAVLPGHQIFFNLSHSKDYVICGFDEKEIGVDIEYITDVDLSVADIVLSNNEKRNLPKFNEKEKLQYFYKIWTLKESYLKYTGNGLTDDLKKISFEFFEKIELYFENAPCSCNLIFSEILLDPNYVCHICHSGQLKLIPKKLTEIEIIKKFID